VDVRAALVANEQSLELVQPGEGTLDDPPVATEPGAVLGHAPCDLRSDPTPAEFAATARVVVSAVAGDPVGPAARPADRATHRRDAVE